MTDLWAKDRDEVLDNKLVWTSRLESSESILTSVWDVLDVADDDANPLLLIHTPQVGFINNDHDGALGAHEYSVQFVAHNGEEGRNYRARNTITTSAGRTICRTIRYRCKRK